MRKSLLLLARRNWRSAGWLEVGAAAVGGEIDGFSNLAAISAIFNLIEPHAKLIALINPP